jgi:hypothetical protein
MYFGEDTQKNKKIRKKEMNFEDDKKKRNAFRSRYQKEECISEKIPKRGMHFGEDTKKRNAFRRRYEKEE